jgi:putative membrane protein
VPGIAGSELNIRAFFKKRTNEERKKMKKVFPVSILTTVPVLTMWFGTYNPMMGDWDLPERYGCSLGFGDGYGGMFMGFLFLILLGLAIYFIIQSLKAKNVGSQIQETPIDILKKRYAKGELTKEDFDRMKNELQ